MPSRTVRAHIGHATFGHNKGLGQEEPWLLCQPGLGLGAGGIMRASGTLPIILALIAMPPSGCPQESNTPTAAGVLDKVIAQERAEMESLRQYSPLVETYIQIRRPDKHVGLTPDGDKYFLGRAELAKGITLEPLA